jgi:hypothetical protein
VSFDVFLQRFKAGDAAVGDGAAVEDVLRPLVEHRDGDWALIVTPDGYSDVYGMANPSSGVMFNHAAGREVWDVMFAVAEAAGFVVMLPGCGTGIVSEAVRDELPDGVPEPVVCVWSGADLLRLVESA